MEQNALGAAAQRSLVGVSYKTHVSIARIGAPRTGAEIGALIVEAGWAKPAAIEARLERIRAGMEALASDQPAVATEAAAIHALWIDLQQRTPGEAGIAWVEALEGQRVLISIEMDQTADAKLAPLVLAGCWLQIADAMTSALIETDHPELASVVFTRPDLSLYFQGYLDSEGAELFPESVVVAMREALSLNERFHGRSDLTLQELEYAHALNQNILGML